MGDVVQFLPPATRAFRRLETVEGVLTWLEQAGPRGPVRWGAELDGARISPDELRLRLLCFYVVERGVC